MSKYKKYAKLLGIIGASTVVGIAVYDFCKAYKILRKPINSNFMQKKSEYIYILVSESVIMTLINPSVVIF